MPRPIPTGEIPTLWHERRLSVVTERFVQLQDTRKVWLTDVTERIAKKRIAAEDAV